MEIIQTRQDHERVLYLRHFIYRYARTSGFAFPCDERGEPLALHEAARQNFAACLAGAVGGRPVLDCGTERRVECWTEPAIGRCACGAEVELAGFTNSCECGADYNWAGQQLAPREQWGEETQETVSDILRIR